MTILNRLRSAESGSRDTLYDCPQCGAKMECRTDQFGRTYQCRAYDCLAFFDADEIEEDTTP